MTMHYTDEQNNYINSRIEDNIYLEACPGSGKTEVVAVKVALELNSWNGKLGGMAVLSFANSAANELADRIFKHLQFRENIFPHFLGTFDSFIYKNIVCPLANKLTDYKGDNGDFSIRIVEPSAKIGYKTKYSYGNNGQIHAHKFSICLTDDLGIEKIIFDTGNDALDRVLTGLKLESYQLKDFINAKEKLLDNGLATYKDIESLALFAVSNCQFNEYFNLLAKRYPLIIIDECQDLSKEQLKILEKFLDNGSKVHFIGDPYQAIYGFRGVDPNKVIAFAKSKNFTHLNLNRNFRSCDNIVNICSQITRRQGLVGNISWLDQRCIILQYQNSPKELIPTFKVLCSNYQNSVILSRGHSILKKFDQSLEQLNPVQKLALSINLYNPKDLISVKQSLEYFSEFVSFYIEGHYKPNSFRCPISIDSNISWRLFLFNCLGFLVKNNAHNFEMSWSVWVKKINMLIQVLSQQEFSPSSISSNLMNLDNIKLRAPKGLASNHVLDFFKSVVV